MINRLSNPINRNRLAAKILKVMSSCVCVPLLQSTCMCPCVPLCMCSFVTKLLHVSLCSNMRVFLIAALGPAVLALYERRAVCQQAVAKINIYNL